MHTYIQAPTLLYEPTYPHSLIHPTLCFGDPNTLHISVSGSLLCRFTCRPNSIPDNRILRKPLQIAAAQPLDSPLLSLSLSLSFCSQLIWLDVLNGKLRKLNIVCAMVETGQFHPHPPFSYFISPVFSS